MLRIRRNDVDAHRVILLLQGHLVGAWAELVEKECRTTIQSGRRVVVDLSGVTFIGSSGFEALARISRAGGGITGCSPLIAEMLEQEGVEVDRETEIVIERMAPGTDEPN